MYFEMACIVPQTVLSCRKWGVTSATAAAYLLTYSFLCFIGRLLLSYSSLAHDGIPFRIAVVCIFERVVCAIHHRTNVVKSQRKRNSRIHQNFCFPKICRKIVATVNTAKFFKFLICRKNSSNTSSCSEMKGSM